MAWVNALGSRDWPFRNNEICVQEWTRVSLNINAYRSDTKLNRIVKKAEFVFYKYIFWKPLLVDKEPKVRTTCSTCGRKGSKALISFIIINPWELFVVKRVLERAKSCRNSTVQGKYFCSFGQIGHTFIIEHVILL